MTRRLNISLWVMQLALAFFALAAGYTHGIMPLDQAAKMAPWTASLSPAFVRFIGYSELAAGVGLVLPAATGILPWLTPLAAAGFGFIMLCAIPFHIMRGESRVIGMHIVVLALSLIVAVKRRP